MAAKARGLQFCRIDLCIPVDNPKIAVNNCTVENGQKALSFQKQIIRLFSKYHIQVIFESDLLKIKLFPNKRSRDKTTFIFFSAETAQ